MIKSKRWPWLTDGWEVVEEVQAEEQAKYCFGEYEPPDFFDLGYVYHPYVYHPVDRIKKCPID